MPKEYVFERTIHGDPDTQANTVRIGWGKNLDYIEISSFSVKPNQAICELNPETQQWEPMIPGLMEQGFLTRLESRRDVNRFIQILKRARDYSFGKDE